ncbi:MAG: hypothetical protein GY913_12975 [Proteobacteria bacterium]|nr:hypothetical protein [Pseudomonadota bacterium]MCP4917820.1 hypothetical protein [Pseudomonadota bacterium]
MILLMLACAGPSEDTLIDELRVLAILAEAPEAAPGQTLAVETVVVDPFEDHQLLQWTCTSLAPGTCLEADEETWEDLTVDEPVTDFTISPALAAVAGDEPLPLVSRWALACEPGACPFLDGLSGSIPDDLRADLQDPAELLRDLPLEGVSLAVQPVDVSTRTDMAENPAVTCTGPSEAKPGETVDFECEVAGGFQEDAAIWGYTSAGAWIGASMPLAPDDTSATYSWVAPDAEQQVELWLVVTDGGRGTAVWSAPLDVR